MLHRFLDQMPHPVIRLHLQRSHRAGPDTDRDLHTVVGHAPLNQTGLHPGQHSSIIKYRWDTPCGKVRHPRAKVSSASSGARLQANRQGPASIHPQHAALHGDDVTKTHTVIRPSGHTHAQELRNLTAGPTQVTHSLSQPRWLVWTIAGSNSVLDRTAPGILALNIYGVK
nr:hypothetical protein CFP56_02615 [Quercus suber]